MTTQPAGEQRTGTLNLTGQGNPEQGDYGITDEMIRAGYNAIAAEYGTQTDMVKHLMCRDARVALEAAYPIIRQHVAEQIASECERRADQTGTRDATDRRDGRDLLSVGLARGYRISAEVARLFGRGIGGGQ